MRQIVQEDSRPAQPPAAARREEGGLPRVWPAVPPEVEPEDAHAKTSGYLLLRVPRLSQAVQEQLSLEGALQGPLEGKAIPVLVLRANLQLLQRPEAARNESHRGVPVRVWQLREEVCPENAAGQALAGVPGAKLDAGVDGIRW
uniref:(northern house mosquito) hypothetical protein n=1 Tax=Culex pipiens TaxID=7175 RepID=A0A8D8CA55_CULPI